MRQFLVWIIVIYAVLAVVLFLAVPLTPFWDWVWMVVVMLYVIVLPAYGFSFWFLPSSKLERFSMGLGIHLAITLVVFYWLNYLGVPVKSVVWVYPLVVLVGNGLVLALGNRSTKH